LCREVWLVKISEVLLQPLQREGRSKRVQIPIDALRRKIGGPSFLTAKQERPLE